MSTRKYTFGLFVGEQAFSVNPIWSDDATLDFDTEQDQVFLRAKLSEAMTFVRDDFDLINDAPFDTRFRLVIEDSDFPGQDFWTGFFYKTDCEFDQNEKHRTVVVKLNTFDDYDNIIARKDKVYNLIDLAPERESVVYVKQPLIQVYIRGSRFVTNFLQGVYWQEPVIQPINSTAVLTDSYFFGVTIPENNSSIVVVPGDNTLDPDVSGYYLRAFLTEGAYIREGDNLYSFNQSAGRWRIVLTSDINTVLYEAPVDEDLHGDPTHSGQGTLFTSTTDPNSTVRVFLAVMFARYLTDELSVNGAPTEDLPTADITGETYGYDKVTALELSSYLNSFDSQDSPTKFGKIVDNAANYAGRYFVRPTGPGGEVAYPLVRSEWTETSYWFYYDAALRQLQEDGSREVTLRHAYPLASVIKVILAEIAPGITYDETTVYSEFLNADLNPVTGEKNVRLFITPKTNIKIGDYDRAATVADIKFSDVDEFLKNSHNAFWFVDASNRFRIEHISWFDRGGSYTENQIGQDLTTFIEPKNQKPWDFKRNVFTYDKLELPEQITFNWMDNTSLPFDGFNIDIRSGFVQKGKVSSKPVNLFTSDIDFIQVQPSSIDDEGFAVLGAFEDFSERWIVPFHEMTADGEEYKIQNGKLSFIFLHSRYFKHNLPGPDVTINKEDVAATTVMRFKNQDLVFPFPSDIDPMQLVQTSAGPGKIKSMTVNFISKSADAKIKHNE